MEIEPAVISVALSVVAVMVAGLGFLVAVEAYRRPARGPGSSGGQSLPAAGPVPRRRHDTEAERDSPDGLDQGMLVPPVRVPPVPDRPDPRTLLDPRTLDLRTLDPRGLRDMAVIRYDALQEMSGQMSFSLALLNSQGDGVVLSSINGRAETRTYAKVVIGGKGTQDLSPEEEEAVRVARMGQRPAEHAQVAGKPKITRQTGARSTASVLPAG
jgi:Protein of unknown function (DUF4446)